MNVNVLCACWGGLLCIGGQRCTVLHTCWQLYHILPPNMHRHCTLVLQCALCIWRYSTPHMLAGINICFELFSETTSSGICLRS